MPMTSKGRALRALVAVGALLTGATASGGCGSGSSTAPSNTDPSHASGADSTKPCDNDAACAANEYCQHPAGACTATGSCRARLALPCTPPTGASVCGCDGRTYASACEVVPTTSVAHDGACDDGGRSGVHDEGGGDAGASEDAEATRDASASRDASAGGGGTSNVTCGGFAAIKCPGGERCMDDPTDGCDPKKGGADCSGVCTCAIMAKCAGGMHFDPSPSVCACVASCANDPCASARCKGGFTCVPGARCQALCVGASDAGRP